MPSTSAAPAVVVIGSVNMDLVVRAPHVPRPGETILGHSFATIPGGKGANQAVATAKLGGNCRFVGRIGDDAFGQNILAGMKMVGVNCDHVEVTEGVPTGVALIVVDELGENAITVASGANTKLSIADIEAAKPLIASAKVCLLQLEIPLETACYAIRLARSLGVEVIVDTAPAPAADKVPQGLFDADILTPNETEAMLLTGEPAAGKREARLVATALAERGARNVVLKLGEKGSLCFDGNHFEHVRPFRIKPVDTTAAGDAFSAALAVSRARGLPLNEAVLYANAAGAAACLKFGAQPAMPSAEEVRSLMMESGVEPKA
jgi:ribokinase